MGDNMHFIRSKTLWLVFVVAMLGIGAIVFATSSFFFGLVGPQSDGTGVTPNHWMLTPAGLQVEVGDRPEAIAKSPDGHYLAITNNGQGVQSLVLFDTFTNKIVQSIHYPEPEALFYGIVWSSDGKALYASAGGNNKIRAYSFENNQLTEENPFVLGDSNSPIFPAGLAISPDGKTLYAALNYGNAVVAINTENRASLSWKKLEFGEATTTTGKDKNTLPYALAISKDGATLYVSHTNASAVSVVKTEDMTLTTQIKVGDQPSGMVLSSDGKLLYVANANSDTVSVIDTASNKVSSDINLKPYEDAPFGSIPNALALTPDGKTLLVTNGGNNDVALVDTASLEVRGLIPAAWFPSAVVTSDDGKFIYLANLKGLGAGPNPMGNRDDQDNPNSQYIGNLARGTLSIIEIPSDEDLATYTATVTKNNGFDETNQNLLRKPESVAAQPIPRRPGEPSVFKHIIYIIKENRTYDQVLGDMPEGNGDPSLTLYGEAITPNQHALAKTFGLFDNFYCDAEVSADGHDWVMAAVASDYTQRLWPSDYSDRNRGYDWEGATDAANPTNGFLFDFAKRGDISYRVYGEFWDYVSQVPDAKPSAYQPNLANHFSPTYLGFDMSYSDQDRFTNWKKEFDDYVKNGDLPQLEIISLPRDHTAGTSKDAETPQAMVADNDLAFGKIVEAVSNSPYWKDTVILSVEDDAQSGPDHVDAHRTVAFAISAYNKPGTVDSTMYSQVSMLRTLELILGLPPMTQFDAAATPMVAAFQDTPDLTPYTAITPKQSLDDMNAATAYGSEISATLDFSKPDKVNEATLNDILWHSSRGENTPMPEIQHTLRTNVFADRAEDFYHRLLRIPPKPASQDVMTAVQGLSLDIRSLGDNR
jgi:YVTN family beta-propeller protein